MELELEKYLSPINLEELNIFGQIKENQRIINSIKINKDNEKILLNDIQIVILGVPESRGAVNNYECLHAANEVRKEFYKLFRWNKPVNIYDLGNLKVGTTLEDTYEALSDVISYFIEREIIPIIIGGSNDLAFANYRAYEKLEQVVNIAAIDSQFNLGNVEEKINSNNYLNSIILQQPNFLLNYSNVGYQSYLNSPESLTMMKELYFDTYRVGALRKDILEVEPIVRNAEMVSIDISAVRRPDAPGNPNASAHGFYGEEICHIAYLTGISEKMSSFGIYEFNPAYDNNNQTAQLISHAIWYFVEGYLGRCGDMLFQNKENYTKFSVTVNDAPENLVFYCSKKTGRWWILVPVIHPTKNINQKYFLPCSEKDYKLACKDIIPERWWLTFNKLNK